MCMRLYRGTKQSKIHIPDFVTRLTIEIYYRAPYTDPLGSLSVHIFMRLSKAWLPLIFHMASAGLKSPRKMAKPSIKTANKTGVRPEYRQ